MSRGENLTEKPAEMAAFVSGDWFWDDNMVVKNRRSLYLEIAGVWVRGVIREYARSNQQ